LIAIKIKKVETDRMGRGKNEKRRRFSNIRLHQANGFVFIPKKAGFQLSFSKLSRR
jgi:hypothetical protein